MELLHNILNSNITGYASIVVSMGTIIFMETRAEVESKLASNRQEQGL